MMINSLLLKSLSRQGVLRPSPLLLRVAQRGLKNPPRYNEENADKINKLDLAAYFDDFMRRRPTTKTGFINLAKENFRRMVERSKNEDDMKTLVYAYVNFLGHRNLVPQTYLDQMLLKALEVGHPEVMLEVIQYHAELIYHPKPAVLQQYIEHFS